MDRRDVTFDDTGGFVDARRLFAPDGRKQVKRRGRERPHEVVVVVKRQPRWSSDRFAAFEAFKICGHVVVKLGCTPHGHDERRCLVEILAFFRMDHSVSPGMVCRWSLMR